MPIEQFAPELEKIISLAEPIQRLAEGFGGPQGPAEGPVWWQEGGYLLFSDIHHNRRMKYTPGQGVALVQEPTNRANGLTRDGFVANFAQGGREGAVAPLCEGIKRPGSRTIRPQ